jgi:hypothetical protein
LGIAFYIACTHTYCQSYKADQYMVTLLIVIIISYSFYLLYKFATGRNGEKSMAARKEVQQEQKPTLLERTMDRFCVLVKKKVLQMVFVFGYCRYCFILSKYYFPSFCKTCGSFSCSYTRFCYIACLWKRCNSFSVRYNVNFHFILFALAFIISPLHETHKVRINALHDKDNKYVARPQLKDYLTTWLNERNVLSDSSKDGYEVYFVMANGGASRSGYWTASVLGNIEDASLKSATSATHASRFSDNIFCLSGTSGGGVG